MKSVDLYGHIDANHRLHAQAPDNLPPGPVMVTITLLEGATDGAGWAEGVAREWADDLADVRQDIYTLDDGTALLSQSAH